MEKDLKYIFENYSTTSIIDIQNNITHKEILKTFYFAPRFINAIDFKNEYYKSENNDGIKQYNYGKYIVDNCPNIKLNFNDVLQLFISQKSQISSMNIEYRNDSNVTFLVGRYSTFISLLIGVIKKFNIKCDIEKNIMDIEIYKYKFNTHTDIYHECVMEYGIWKWVCDSDIQKGMNILEDEYNKCINNITNENIASFYYLFISLSPFTRGSAGIAEIFRFYFHKLNGTEYYPVKLQYMSLCEIILCIPYEFFVNNYMAFLDTTT